MKTKFKSAHRPQFLPPPSLSVSAIYTAEIIPLSYWEMSAVPAWTCFINHWILTFSYNRTPSQDIINPTKQANLLNFRPSYETLHKFISTKMIIFNPEDCGEARMRLMYVKALNVRSVTQRWGSLFLHLSYGRIPLADL